jgi:hypothetical protein
MASGKEEGLAVEGCCVVGDSDGERLVIAEGLKLVGSLVVDAEGAALGNNDGMAERVAVGTALSPKDGDTLGASEGMLPTTYHISHRSVMDCEIVSPAESIERSLATTV